MARKLIDIEASNLLNHESIDYLKAPYELKPTYNVWCLVERDIDNPLLVRRYVGLEEIRKWIEEELPKITMLVAHNGIDFDFLVLKLLFREKFNYVFSAITGELSTLNGRPVEIVDTLVVSKCLNPDRYGGHSLDEWGKRLGEPKTDWRSEAVALGLIPYNAPKGAEFQQYHPRMLAYCEQDTAVNVKVFWALVEEMGEWNWSDALCLEHYQRDITTRQSHRGFAFNSELAEENIRFLDAKMEEIRQIVEPLLPPKPMGKTALKAYLPPKIQFKKNGEISAVMFKWMEKHNGRWVWNEDRGGYVASFYSEAKVWNLPMDCEVPIKTHEPATVKDTTHIKGYLVSLGWKPTQYKERDLTCDAKKQKLSQEKFEAAVERYVEQTLESPFCADRCAELDVHPNSLRTFLLRHKIERPLKVYTNPTITVGMEKEIDPALLELADQFPHAKLVSEYLTYAHRRNSILGGGVDPDEIEEDDEFAGKGFIAAGRVAVDGRIPTPADTCGAGTSRFKHKLVANIPRVTSLFGKEMRGMFGVDVDDGFIQLGYDFDSLEANIEAHYVYKYPGGPEYGVSLTAEKPNDCHSVLARKISELLGRTFPRGPAKNVKYGCSYNAQPARVAKTVGCTLEEGRIIFDAFWEQAAPLRELKEKMQEYWATTGQKKFLRGIDGRKLPIRSKGNVINSAFQSAGVICAKRAQVIHEQKLKKEGLFVDFFLDNWKEKEFFQQLIAYHDEAQGEVKRSLVTWKKFASEEECKAFKTVHGEIWSDPVHNDRGWFKGYCRAGELAAEAVRESGEYYKLNVPLTAGYMLGRNWAECH